MIRPNWDIFKGKFENHQAEFEWLCYLLFCKEFGKPLGIFRYKNQSAIETNPVETGKEVIGWQAKFYDTTLTAHEDELITTLESAKRNYSTVTKLILYTNQEWVQRKGKEPKGKKALEEKAKSLNLRIEWRTASYFESPFVSIDNEIIVRHFFTHVKSGPDFIEELQRHSENILRGIQTSIPFKGQRIEIERNSELEQIEREPEQVLIVSGGAGVGKTALIKNVYERQEEKIPFYVFKATEFEVRNISELFDGYGLHDFLEIHKVEKRKVVLVDSAEKLLGLNDTDPFKEFLSVLAKDGWRIIFTTRDDYLEDLNFQFFEIYKITPLNVSVKNLEIDQLTAISERYDFSLPRDEKLLQLIKNPFYLSEYLKFYDKGEEIDYVAFKEKLWNVVVKKSKPVREQCFLKLSFERVSSGQFFVNPQCDPKILDGELRSDGILGYESPHGYFITHDMYEEWALEKIIDLEFGRKTDNKTFFQKIGNSLPMRRALRMWVSEKLLLGNDKARTFIWEVLKDGEIEDYWKDEVLVSILLSDYSEGLFQGFEKELSGNDQELLKRLAFLLRIACKEVDDDYFRQLGAKGPEWVSFKYVFTKPKGQGWKELIEYIFGHLDEIGVQNISFVLPAIHDWNSKFREGETTRYASLIALEYYRWIIKENVHFSRDSARDELLQTILSGFTEIKSELEEVIGEVVEKKWKHHRDPYYDLSKAILTKLEGIGVSKVIPASVLRLAELFWFSGAREGLSAHSGIGVEEYYNLEDDHFDYFPASSYQTPTYWLLQSSLKMTVDFILEFTNRTTEAFAVSDLAKYEVEEIEVLVGEGSPVKQYISDRLWCTYRGTQVAPNVLESMHMALEKFFLENGERTGVGPLTGWLLYLLQNSRSASISAVVASIVLAYPDKTFDAAKALFRTKEFLIYDTRRLMLDQTQKSSLQSLHDNFGSNAAKKVHEEERLKACDDKHRNLSLEHLFLNYQLFRSEEVSEEESEKRREVLWGILDEYYEALPDPSEETDSDKTWRLYLARMDRRKMKPSAKRREGGILVNLNPELAPELKEYSEKSLEKSSEPMKYTSLRMWAYHKMRNDEKYKQYDQYEKDPRRALAEVQEIVSRMGTADDEFQLFNYSIPADVCSVLLKDHFDLLSEEERAFCKDIVVDTATLPFRGNYRHQLSDGVGPAISVLPVLLERFPKEREDVKTILLLVLFNDYHINMAGTRFNAFSGGAVHTLWRTYFDDAQSLLLGYLLLKPRYEELRKRLHDDGFNNGVYEISEAQLVEKFLEENETDLQKMVTNKICLGDLKDIRPLDLYILKTAFALIPLKTENADQKEIVKMIMAAFAAKLLAEDGRDDRVDYEVKHDFLRKLAYFVLSSSKEEVGELLKPFIDNFDVSETIAELFKEFIVAEDDLNSYEAFWEVWGLFNQKVIEISAKGDGYWYTDEIIKSYLFAQSPWNDTATEWQTFKDRDRNFFREMSEKTGHCHSTLYAISRLLNGVGSTYLDDGISWISRMLRNNKNLLDSKRDSYTVYYLENVIRRYTYKNREKIRKTNELKENALIILDFLILKGSVIGYMLRENVL